ncbi:hypothetical protein [Sagittula salina]|uniref:Uncharacterized protein n=1 Tax=Sagittula salina TaxID=2820268 RepID=A0A940S2U2_9RHOB|nr:hypothetical protein [Sagittula salina]MBP0482045.1 hypothetical protein [Sagittula salina]
MGRWDHTFGAAGLVALTVVTAVGITLAMTFQSMPPRAGMPVVVFAAPWQGGAEALVVASGGALIAPWASGRLAALASYEGEIPVDTLGRLGAWAVTDGEAIAAICGAPN